MAEQPGERSTLQERVYAGLSADLASGVLAPGERLRVAHLAKRFGTSQAPVREALRRLTEEGRAETVPYVGSVVREPSWSEIQDIYALRAELEAYAIRRILARAPAPSFLPVHRALRELGRAVRTEDEVQVIDADLDFHRAICALADSDLTLEMWESLVRRFRGVRLSLMRDHPDGLGTVVPSHAGLVGALESGDAELAQAAFRNHLTEAVARFDQRADPEGPGTSIST